MFEILNIKLWIISVKLKRYEKTNLDIFEAKNRKSVISIMSSKCTIVVLMITTNFWDNILLTFYIKDYTTVCLKGKYEGKPVQIEYWITPTLEKPFEQLQKKCDY